MKRNLELIRHLLLKLEAVDGGSLVLAKDGALALEDAFDPDVITEHFHQLVNNGLLLGDSSVTADGSLFFRGLSWKGHDFLAAVRDQSAWARTKKAAAGYGEGITLDMVKELAKTVGREGFRSLTGI